MRRRTDAVLFLLTSTRALADRYVALVDVDQWLHFRAADRQRVLGATLHDADGAWFEVDEADASG